MVEEKSNNGVSSVFGSWLKLFANDNGVVTGENEVQFSITLPTYDEKIPEFDDIEGHNKCTIADMEDHFGDIARGCMRIEMINDVNFEDLITGKLVKCSGCLDVTSKYYCCDEGKDIVCKQSVVCIDCFDSKHLGCKHEKKYIEEKRLINFMNQYCDVCGCDAYKAVGQVWYYNPALDTYGRFDETSFDDALHRIICIACAETSEWKDEISSWKPVTVQLGNDVAGIGSLLDWVPVLMDSRTYAAILYNMNTKSPRYHQVILRAVDDHGREGWFIYPNAANPMSLDEVLEAISMNAAAYTHEESWESHYDCPIHKLLSAENYQISYG